MTWLDKGKSLLKGTADVASAAAGQVIRGQERLRDATGGVIGRTGKVLRTTGELTDRTASQMAQRLHHHADRTDALALKSASRAAAWAAGALSLPGQALRRGGEITGKVAPRIGTAAGSTVAGGAAAACGLIDSLVLAQADIDALRGELRQHGQRLAEDSAALQRRIASAARRQRRRQLLEMLVVGGRPLGAALPPHGQLPGDIKRAFALSRPDLAAAGGLPHALQHLPTGQLPVLACTLKVTLFELQLVDHFNAGTLPDGMRADMAVSAIQPGRGICILDDYGLVVDRLQTCVTATVEAVRQALMQHPGLDVTGLVDLQAQLLALAAVDTTPDSCIDEVALQSAIEQAAVDGRLAIDPAGRVPTAAALAAIQLSVLLDGHTDWRELPATPEGPAIPLLDSALDWWTGLVTGVGSYGLAGKGHARRRQYQALQQAVAHLRNHPTTPPGLQPFVG